MKKLISAIAFMLTGILSIAQNDSVNTGQTPQTLFKNPKHIGWYVAPEFGYTRMDGRDVFLGGFFGGIIFDHSFSLGAGGYGITNSYNLKYNDVAPMQDVYLYGGYGGLRMEYTLHPSKVVHVSFPLLIGGGMLSYNKHNMNDYHNSNMNDYQDESFAYDNFFVIEPGVLMGVNLIKFIRLDVGITYRYAPNVQLPNTSTGVFNSLNAVVSLKFGKF